MSERTTTRYQRLFEVRILHHYLLDEGAVPFDSIADSKKRAARLLAYDVRPMLHLRPTPSTARLLAQHRCVYRQTALGAVCAAPATTLLPSDTTFSFVVAVVDALFNDVTSLTLRPQPIVELRDADANPLRYKQDVPLLSNLTGATRGAGTAKSLFLSRENPAPAAADAVDALVVSGSALLQLTSDGPGAKTQQLAAQAQDLPVYLHQGDTAPIVAPAGVAGAPARGILLIPDIPDDIFALITLTAVRGDDDDFSFVDATGAPRSPPPVYQIHFKNRSTFRRYVNKSTGAVISTDTDPAPLTRFGNAGAREKPEARSLKVERTGARITQLVSEVFV
jgi:hypothetical protein